MKFTRGSARLFRRSSLFVLAVLLVAVGAWAAHAGTQNASWLTGGQNLDNSRYQASESVIGTGNVATLTPKAAFANGGAFVTGGDVSATPAVDGQRVYFPDSAGHLYAVDRSTGAMVWTANIADMTGIKPANGATANDYARTTPAIAGHTLIIGDQAGKFETPTFAAAHPELAGAYVLGINKDTGALLWKTKVHDHFAAIVTQSAQVDGQTAYVGVSSFEETYANQFLTGALTGSPFPYTCCSFRGKFVALDINSGAIKWATYTVPAQTGYSGGAVWGSTPAIDLKRNAVYITTGNNYSLPADKVTCVQTANTNNTDPRACLPDDNFDSIVSLNMQTGAINWSYRALPSDAWNTDCGLPPFAGGDTNPGNCPSSVQGPDYDFGQGPMLLTANVAGKNTDIVGAGGKSGIFTALNRDTGAKLWDKIVAPGGTEGGMQWGSASDGKRIYVARSNSGDLSRGGWSALDPSTGNILWQAADPGVPVPGIGVYGFSAQGPVSTANGVVYACSLNPIGPQMVAMDAATGAIKWTYNSGSSCLGGAAIANGTVYWGTGYRLPVPLTTPGNKLFAFTPNGN
jgi:polyvinyl alcohol dehydrogenase (cytochrome)